MFNDYDYKLQGWDFFPVTGTVRYEERNPSREGKFEDPRAELRHSFLNAYNAAYILIFAVVVGLEAIVKEH